MQEFFAPKAIKEQHIEVQKAAEGSSSDPDDGFSVGYWILIYCLFVLLHTMNTALVYQRWIGKPLKQMSHEEKLTDLPKVRWLAAAFVSVICPIASFLFYSVQDMPARMLDGNWWLSWTAMGTYVLISLLFYNVSFETSSRKDALIPTKRHSVFLLLTVPPVVIVYELFLSLDALGYRQPLVPEVTLA